MITSPADTLVCDSAQLAAFRSDAAYDYNRELITPEINIFEWIRGQFGELLGKIFGSRFAEEYSGLIMICLAILLLLLIVWFVYKKRPELFMRRIKIHFRILLRKIPFMALIFRKALMKHCPVGITGKRYVCSICRH